MASASVTEESSESVNSSEMKFSSERRTTLCSEEGSKIFVSSESVWADDWSWTVDSFSLESVESSKGWVVSEDS